MGYSRDDGMLGRSQRQSNNFKSLSTEGRTSLNNTDGIRETKDKRNTRLDPVNNKREGKIVLVKKSKKLGLEYYIIEVAIENGLFRITADDVENPLTRILEMKENDGLKILNKFFNNNIESLLDALKINDQILIKGLEKYSQTQQTDNDKSKPPKPPLIKAKVSEDSMRTTQKLTKIDEEEVSPKKVQKMLVKEQPDQAEQQKLDYDEQQDPLAQDQHQKEENQVANQQEEEEVVEEGGIQGEYIYEDDEFEKEDN